MKPNLIKQLFVAIGKDDPKELYTALTTLIQEERKLGHTVLADQLETFLEKKDFKQRVNSKCQPKANQAAEVLFKKIPHDHLRHDGIFTELVESQLHRIEQEYVARDRLAHHGLRYRQTILLYGPPGCGKTMAAERIAWNTGLVVVKPLFLDVSTFPCMLDAIAKFPSLLLIDEVGANFNHTTLLRLLNEYDHPQGLLVVEISSTKFLDEAICHRLDDVIEIAKPTVREIELILKQTLNDLESQTVDWQLISQKMLNCSAAQVVKIAQHAAKRVVLSQEKYITQNHLEESINYYAEKKAYL